MDEIAQPGARYWSVIEPYWSAVSIHDGADAFLLDFRAVPEHAGNLFASHWCQSEVCNGGFHQFFWNSTGVLAPEALAGFRAIGLSEWESILAEAMSYFGDPYPRDRALRLALLPTRDGRERRDWDPFDDLDERFYSWLHAEYDRWDRAADRFAGCHCGLAPQ